MFKTHKIVGTFPAVLHGCEIWFLAVMDNHKLEIKMLRKFESKRHELINVLRKLHNVELHSFFGRLPVVLE
jgi:hypothetical protein